MMFSAGELVIFKTEFLTQSQKVQDLLSIRRVLAPTNSESLITGVDFFDNRSVIAALSDWAEKAVALSYALHYRVVNLPSFRIQVGVAAKGFRQIRRRTVKGQLRQ
jgi:hypothetical protein